MDLQTTMEAFRKKGYQVSYFPTAQEAADYLDREIDGKTVGFGDSETLLDMKLYERLEKHNQVTHPMKRPADMTFDEKAKESYFTEVLLLSVNGASETGELVNLDGLGNRVGTSLFGHEKVYFVFSTNKIEPTLEKAIWRTRNIAAPKKAKRKGYTTPCALKGDRCYDCNHPDRICNGLVIHLHKMKRMDTELVLIGEPMGF